MAASNQRHLDIRTNSLRNLECIDPLRPRASRHVINLLAWMVLVVLWMVLVVTAPRERPTWAASLSRNRPALALKSML